MISAKLKEHLDNAGVTYEGHPHPPAYTSLEIAQSVHIPGREMAKSVILKADEEKLVMAVLSANDAANLDVLREEIGCSRLRFSSEAASTAAIHTFSLHDALPVWANAVRPAGLFSGA